MKIYIIITAVFCCLLILFPLIFNSFYKNTYEDENTATTTVTVSESNILV